MFRTSTPRSLKKSLIVSLLLSTVIPIVLMGIGSYYVIYTILDHKIGNSIQSTLHQVRSNIETTYNNLNYVSQQLTNNDLQLFFQSNDVMERYILGQTVFKNLDIISYTNPDIGLFYYYTPPNNTIFYQNQEVRSSENPNERPILSVVKGVTYYGPHRSLSHRNENVLSVSRSINIAKQSEMHLYVETNSFLYSQLLNSTQYGMNAAHLLADHTGAVVFSQDEEHFPAGMVLPVDFGGSQYAKVNDYYLFRDYSPEQGWFVYSVVSPQTFRSETVNWMLLSLAIAAISLLFSGLLGWSIWKKFYFPLSILTSEIRKFEGQQFQRNGQPQQDIRLTQITEFDVVLLQFQDMRMRILMLLRELKQNEEDKRFLEVEKLVAQINPHFLYNTLNTVQWLAKSNGQEDIVNLIAIFTRLLRYNLGKNGGVVELSQEIEALRDYIALQQIRYNYKFAIEIHAEPETLQVPVPRFLLQPLIENALYHGQAEDGATIELSISAKPDGYMMVSVKDHGKGMSDEQIRKLIEGRIPEREKVGMGIGLHYVNTMLRVHYGEETSLTVESHPNEGTTIRFNIPLSTKELGGPL